MYAPWYTEYRDIQHTVIRIADAERVSYYTAIVISRTVNNSCAYDFGFLIIHIIRTQYKFICLKYIIIVIICGLPGRLYGIILYSSGSLQPLSQLKTDNSKITHQAETQRHNSNELSLRVWQQIRNINNTSTFRLYIYLKNDLCIFVFFEFFTSHTA